MLSKTLNHISISKLAGESPNMRSQKPFESLLSLVTETPPYERLMSPTMEKIWIAVTSAFHKSHQPFERIKSLREALEGQSQVEASALEELEVALAAEALALE